ncbi:signal peptidase I [Paraglaciecola marina]|uniref:signal peptidase I n=1 Tax=Paraglaciecola marina TaxID=2500157 RepID=UPI00105BD78D|nr:signal peptidase I [Paraglaciecola marina]
MQLKSQIQNTIKQNSVFILVMLLMFASRSSLADWYHVPTGSMLPTIVEGDRILVNKMAYRLEVPFTDITVMEIAKPKRGDIVVFNSVKADNRLVKRLIAEPGDTVAMESNKLIINGTPVHYEQREQTFLQTEYLENTAHFVQFTPVANPRDSFESVTVPEGQYLVLGDNRNNSADSRYYGFVPAIEIQGKATKVLLSLNPDNYYLPRKERLLTPLI